MCTNKHFINSPYVHYPVLVSCGHCPACKQAKAISRTNRIRANFPDQLTLKSADDRILAVFVTLTYSNSNIPYIHHSDLYFLKESNDKYKCDNTTGYDYRSFVEVPVYRDGRTRWVRSKKGYFNKRSTKFGDEPLIVDTLKFPIEYLQDFKPQYLRGQKDCKISVCLFSDLQRFQKRLRKFCVNDGINYSFYQCTEYGPTTCRAHAHMLAFVTQRDYKSFKDAVVKAWPYDDGYRTRANIEIARDAASYVSSYVNCDASVPRAFEAISSIRPKHSYSQGFGATLSAFSLRSVISCIERGDLHVSVPRLRKGVLVVDDILLPKYVINRYFPKFKGYSRLTSDEIQSICLRPQLIEEYKSRLDLDVDDVHRIRVMLKNKAVRAVLNGVHILDWSRYYSRVWSIYASNVLRDQLTSFDLPHQNFYAYDNISDFYDGLVQSPSLEEAAAQLPPSFIPIYDCNAFPSNLLKHSRLTLAYYRYSKDRKIRNYVYSQSTHV